MKKILILLFMSHQAFAVTTYTSKVDLSNCNGNPTLLKDLVSIIISFPANAKFLSSNINFEPATSGYSGDEDVNAIPATSASCTYDRVYSGIGSIAIAADGLLNPIFFRRAIRLEVSGSISDVNDKITCDQQEALLVTSTVPASADVITSEKYQDSSGFSAKFEVNLNNVKTVGNTREIISIQNAEHAEMKGNFTIYDRAGAPMQTCSISNVKAH